MNNDSSPGGRVWLWRGAAAAWCAVIFALSAQSGLKPGFLAFIPFVDKVAHFLLYMVLGYLSAGAAASDARPGLRRMAWPAALMWAAAYGASDEYHQSFVPGRTPDVLDWAADVAGAAMGAAVFVKIFRR